jgi:hypothetical protein
MMPLENITVRALPAQPTVVLKQKHPQNDTNPPNSNRISTRNPQKPFKSHLKPIENGFFCASNGFPPNQSHATPASPTLELP